MTGGMAACPEPPHDLSLRSVPEYLFNIEAMPLYRIHRSAYDPLFFNRRRVSASVFRFDAAHDEFGVLYASPSFTVCMAETVIRDLFEGGSLPLTIDESELACRSIASIGVAAPRALRLADFTQPLFGLGGSVQIMSVDDYAAPNLWSSAVYAHPNRFDGIYFPSRFTNDAAVAIFDRVDLVVRGIPVPLLNFHELGPFLDRHGIGIV